MKMYILFFLSISLGLHADTVKNNAQSSLHDCVFVDKNAVEAHLYKQFLTQQNMSSKEMVILVEKTLQEVPSIDKNSIDKITNQKNFYAATTILMGLTILYLILFPRKSVTINGSENTIQSGAISIK